MLNSEGEDTGESVEVSQPPTVRLDEPDSFLYNQSVILTGRTLDSSVNVVVIAATANGGITSDATFSSKNRFVLEKSTPAYLVIEVPYSFSNIKPSSMNTT